MLYLTGPKGKNGRHTRTSDSRATKFIHMIDVPMGHLYLKKNQKVIRQFLRKISSKLGKWLKMVIFGIKMAAKRRKTIQSKRKEKKTHSRYCLIECTYKI